MNRFFILLAIIFIGLCFASCNKWDPNENINTNGLIESIENANGETIASFEYNNNGTLKSFWESKQTFFTGSRAEYNFKYNQNNQTTDIEGFEPGNMIMCSIIGASDHEVHHKYEYDQQGRLSKKTIEYHYPEMPEIDYSITSEFEYPSNAMFIETISNTSISDKSYLRYEYIFNKNENIEKIISYSIAENGEEQKMQETTMLYDNKNTPAQHFPGLSSKNNIIEKTEIFFDLSDTNIERESYRSTYYIDYEYNTNGYPKKVTTTQPNNYVTTVFYNYYKP